MNREEKSAAIQEIAAQIEESEAIFAVDYRGISVPQAAELRSKLREADASFRIVKNRLTKIAADKAGEERLAELLSGPTALTFVRGDTAQAAKAITTFNKEHEVLTYKGGFMDATSLDEDAFKSIARLPSRDVLNGQFAGIVASPLTGLVRGLGSMIQGLALQLGQIAENGLVSGEAPAAEAAPEAAAEEGAGDAPVEEAPTEASSGNEPPADQAEAPDDDAGATEPSDTAEETGDGDATPAGDADEESSPAASSREDEDSSSAAGPADEGSEPSSDEADTSETDDASKEEE
ncbi:MAG: 50S ribosomal protein L10 [Solirubrobacterales bacterium]